MQREIESESLVNSLEPNVNQLTPHSAVAGGSFSKPSNQGGVQGLVESLGQGFGSLGSGLTSSFDQPICISSIASLMDGTGGMFDNLLSAPASLFDDFLEASKKSQTQQTARGEMSSASLMPNSMQEHRQIMQMRQRTAKTPRNAGSSSKSGTSGKEKNCEG